MQDDFPFLSRLKINPHWRELQSEQEVFSLPLPVKDHRFIDSSLTKIGSGITVVVKHTIAPQPDLETGTVNWYFAARRFLSAEAI